MRKVPVLLPIAGLRANAARVLDRVQKKDEPVVITERGRAVAVLVSVDAYERSGQEREIIRLLVQGNEEVAAGKGYALEDVLEEADRITRSRVPANTGP